MKQNTSSQIDYKSSKSELWAAYKAVLEQKPEPHVETKPVKTDLDWQQQISKNVKQVSDKLIEKEEELSGLFSQIDKARTELEKVYQIKAKAATVEELEDKITQLQNLYTRKQKQLEEDSNQEKQWRLKRIEKEEEEKTYDFETKHRLLERSLEEKEKNWAEKEKRYQQLVDESVKLPEVLQKTKELAVKETTTLLQKEFAQEKQLTEQKHQSDAQLADQQIKNQIEVIKNLDIQIKSLSSQLTEAHQKIKELAVAALEANKPKEEKTEHN